VLPNHELDFLTDLETSQDPEDTLCEHLGIFQFVLLIDEWGLIMCRIRVKTTYAFVRKSLLAGESSQRRNCPSRSGVTTSISFRSYTSIRVCSVSCGSQPCVSCTPQYEVYKTGRRIWTRVLSPGHWYANLGLECN
jgi:hypothetical protein